MSAIVSKASASPRLRTSVIISVLDQAWLSAANLLLGVFLIKYSSKEEYGSYVLGYAIILFLVGVQNALVSTQMSVLAPARSESEQGRFCSALAIGQFLIFVPAVLVIVLVGLILGWNGATSGSGLAYAIAISLLGVILREFFRSYFFLRLRPTAVLSLDIAFVGLLFGGLWVAVLMKFPFLNLAALAIMGAASAIVGLAAVLMARNELPVRLADIRPALKESWQHGRWALGGVTVTWLQDQSYIYLLSAMVSTAETAEASAARLFLAPLTLLNVGFSRVLMPRWAYMAHEGKHQELVDMANRVKWLLVSMVVAYVAVLLLLKDWLTPLLLTKAYTQTGPMILLWGMVFALQAVRGNYASQLQVFKRFRDMTLANTATAIGVLLIGAILIKAYGVKGSMITLILGEAALATLLAYGFKNVRKNTAH
jgi:O-antigen/teichoic acid export membrane protein